MLLHFSFVILFVLVYIYGFFPTSSVEVFERQEPPIKISNNSIDRDTLYKSKFDRVVLIIVDAMRTDFVGVQNMPFTSKIASEHGCIQRVKVECPTVTLPRIKSLTTGSIPQFIDVVLNLGNSDHQLKDSLLHSLRRQNKKIIFYGDDTWLKLFPNYFLRSEGTTSFFVNDFKEVDENVTRNVKSEIDRTDWDFLILHYLGLDHIGHVYGPRSDLISAKLLEMDKIISFLFNALNDKKKTLFLITGDHGMKDSGGHGGSTAPETNVPLVIFGMKCANDTISQIDIPANLAVLLGLNIPSTSIGLLKKSLLNELTVSSYLYALRYNTLLLSLKSDKCDFLDLATEYHSTFIKNNDTLFAKRAEELYEKCSVVINEDLVESRVDQNITYMTIALINLVYLFALILQDLNYLRLLRLVTVNVIYIVTNNLPTFTVIAVSIILYEYFTFFLLLSNSKRSFRVNNYSLFFLVLTIIYPFTLLSSSFVEEEHQFWYFVLSSSMALNILLTIFFSRPGLLYWVVAFILVRFSRTINQTGDKWSSLPDVSDWLLKDENYLFLQLFFLIGVASVYYLMHKISSKRNKLDLYVSVSFLLIIISRTFTQRKLFFEKCAWFIITLKLILYLLGKSNIVTVWIFISVLLLKPYNIILLAVCVFVSSLFMRIYKKVELSVVCHIWLSNALYFMQGHSNSLASIDISVGYTGLSSYIPVLVGLQIFFHTYVFQILCHLLLLRNLHQSNVKTMWKILCLYRLCIIILFFTAIIIHRHHLFIWSVFAPKLLFEVSHTFALFIELILYYATNIQFL